MPKKLLQPLPFYLYLAVVSLIILYPIFLMVKISASHPADIMKPHKDLLWGPAGITLEHWHNVFTSGLLLPSLGKSLLVATMVMLLAILIGTFEAIPLSLEEASSVDGASKIRTLRKVIFPLSRPGIAVAAMLVWLESWNEFTYALYLTVSENTLPLQTYYYLNRGGIFNSAAYATIITLPVIVLTFILQRYITSGMLAGGVK